MKGHLSLWMKSTTYKEEGSGDKFWECLFSKVPFCAETCSPPFSSLYTFHGMSRDRIVHYYRQSCWHFLSFIFKRLVFWISFVKLLFMLRFSIPFICPDTWLEGRTWLLCSNQSLLYTGSSVMFRIVRLVAGWNSLLRQGLQIKASVNTLRALETKQMEHVLSLPAYAMCVKHFHLSKCAGTWPFWGLLKRGSCLSWVLRCLLTPSMSRD